MKVKKKNCKSSRLTSNQSTVAKNVCLNEQI